MAKAGTAKTEKVKKTSAKVKKSAKKAVAEATESTGRTSIVNDQVFQDRVVGMREQGKKWGEISEATGVSSGRVQLAYMKASGGTSEPTPKAIYNARVKDKLSWGRIIAQFDVTEGQARKLFVEGGGDLNDATHNLGGRRAAGVDAPAKPAKAKKEATPKAKAKGRGKKAVSVNADMSDEELVAAIDGRKIAWTQARTGTEATAKVKAGTATIKTSEKTGKRVVSFNDGSKSRSVDIKTILKVS